jgi:hypothetical protein
MGEFTQCGNLLADIQCLPQKYSVYQFVGVNTLPAMDTSSHYKLVDFRDGHPSIWFSFTAWGNIAATTFVFAKERKMA